MSEAFENHITTAYDNQLSNLGNLQWLPWAWKNYNSTKVAILGDSWYEDGDDWIKNNENPEAGFSDHLSYKIP